MMTLERALQIMPRCPRLLAEARLPFFNDACLEFEINTPKRLSAFIAQGAHESIEWRHFDELWGPTEWQLKYEGHRGLGNTHPGDGLRFKGRGMFQITGRANYQLAGEALGLDLVADPPRASDKEIAFRTAGWFWNLHGLSALADVGDFAGITRHINGPAMLGQLERLAYYNKALAVLA